MMVGWLFSYCHCNELPLNWWLQATQIYYFTYVKIRSLKHMSLGWNQDMSRTVFLLKTLGENTFSCLFWFAEVTWSLGLWPLSSKLAIASLWPQVLLLLSLSDSFPLSLIKDSCESMEPAWIFQNILKLTEPWVPLPPQCPPLCHSILTGFRGWGEDTCSVYHRRELLDSAGG